MKTIASEILPSVVVFLVALPLCMGIAIASGVPPILGLISGIIGGLVIGPIAGSPLQVSGPAAGLAVLVFELVDRHGLAVLGPVVFVGGLLQVAAGSTGLGRWFRAVSPSVIHGMLGGIGVLIFASQFHVMVDDVPVANGVSNLAAIPAALWKGVVPLDGSPHHLAAIVGVATLGVLMAHAFLQKKIPQLNMIPAPLAAVGTGALVATVMQMPIRYVEVPTDLAKLLPSPLTMEWSALLNPAVMGATLALVVIASAESLLSAAAVDKLHDGPAGDLDKELRAQGIGNAVAGLFGAMPITGVIVRSSANVAAGAKTRWSAVLHGLWLLIAVVALPWALAYIPVASLAALLVYIGWKLFSPVRNIKERLARGRGELGIYLATITAIVATNLLEGLMVGLVLAVLHLAWKLSRLEVTVNDSSHRVDVLLQGTATFITLPRLSGVLEGLPQDKEVHVHLETLNVVDHACLEWLTDWDEGRPGLVVLEWETLRQRLVSRAA